MLQVRSYIWILYLWTGSAAKCNYWGHQIVRKWKE